MDKSRLRTLALLFALAALTLPAFATSPITINTTTATCGGQAAGKVWEINNGALDICFYPAHNSIIDMFPVGTIDNLVDQTQASGGAIPKGFYMDNAGFGTPAGVPGFDLTDKYLDWWETYPSGTGNSFTYSQHWIVTPNDPGVHVYFVADHATNDATGSIGQVQWVFRLDLNKFNNLFMANEDLSNPGPVTLGPMPTYAEYFGTVNTNGIGAADPGRAVQDATVDMHGYGTDPWAAFPPIAPTFGRQFGDKYDYSGYSYLNLAHGVYGSQYGAWVVFPSNESLVGGPTKQMLLFTGNLDMIEAFSNHLVNGITDTTPTGTASHRLFGPFYVRFNTFGRHIRTPEDMYRDAITAGTDGHGFFDGHEGRDFSSDRGRSEDHGRGWGDDGPAFGDDDDRMMFARLYDHETDLLAAGYAPTDQRGDVRVQVRGLAGEEKSAWAVLSDPGKNFQYSSGAQYWIDISRGGSGTFHHVIPGTYRLSVYDLGHWGELRQENVVVTAGQEVVVPTVSFVRENFGDRVWTIGIPDRSSHEFLHGQDAKGHDDREFWGNWNYWADFAANQGAVVYNATSGPAGPATNDLSKWNYNHWKTFDPGLFGGFFCNAADDKTDGYTCVVPSYVAALPGASGTNGVSTPTPPWTVNFATPSDVSNFTNGFAVLSVSLAATEASYIVTLNGQQLVWSNVNKSDAAIRSGLSGYTQWIAFQWPTSALMPAGQNNVLTIGVSQPQGDEDDALRLELTNTSAAPSVRGWNDYSFVTAGATGGSVTVPPNDAVPNP